MNKKLFFSNVLIFISIILLIKLIFALSAPSVIYPSDSGLRINDGAEINWTASADSGIVKYHLFFSNNSGLDWHQIVFDWGYENRLNDSSIIKNLSFTGNQNLTEYILMPKVANVASAKLNLTGYPYNLPGNYTKAYNSFANEGDNDGAAEYSADALSLGRIAAYYPVDVYLLIYTPPTADISMIGIPLASIGNSPQLRNIIYNISIAEAADYLAGDPIIRNTSAYTLVRNQINLSAEWGTSNNVYKNVTLDTAYSMNSSKKYFIWFQFVNSQAGVNSGYSINYDSSPVNNYTASRYSSANKSYDLMADIQLYTQGKSNSSNIWLEVGSIDNNQEWNFTGNFSLKNTTNDFNSSLQSYINNCNVNLRDNCSVPVTIHSDTAGKIQISGINIQFTNYWWNTSSYKELRSYRVNITPTDGIENGTSDISDNDFTITHLAPDISLNLPPESYVNDSFYLVNVAFNCSATDDWGLENISLFITDSTNHFFSLNQTSNLSGLNDWANWTLGLGNGNYTWNCLAYDGVGNNKWESNRSIKINYTDPIYPNFSNYYDNNASLSGSGIALFNVTVTNTNGTVFLEIRGVNYTASNVSNVYNVSVSLTTGAYSYYWGSWGNGSSNNYNISLIRSYTVNPTVTVTKETGTTGGGGGSTAYECSKNSDCPKEKVCYNNKCINLFDVKVIKFDSPIQGGEFFNFVYSVKNADKINNDVTLSFWIEKDKKVLASGSDIIYFGSPMEKVETTHMFLPKNSEAGVYYFYVQASYLEYKANAFRTIEIIKKEDVEAKEPICESPQADCEKSQQDFSSKITVLILKCLLFGIILASIILLIIFILKKERRKNLYGLRNNIGLKVYAENGNKIGKIKEVYLENNKIYGWIIKPDKKIAKRIKKNKILVKHKHIKSIGEIMIIEEKVAEHLEKLAPECA